MRTVRCNESTIEEVRYLSCNRFHLADTALCAVGVLDFDEFLKLYKSCLSNARVRGKYADKMTVKYKEGKAVLTVMTPSVSAAGALLFSILCCSHTLPWCCLYSIIATWTRGCSGVITEVEEHLDDQSEESGEWDAERQHPRPAFESGFAASTPTKSETSRNSTASARRSGTTTASHATHKRMMKTASSMSDYRNTSNGTPGHSSSAENIGEPPPGLSASQRQAWRKKQRCALI
jgi:hypothetical protein|eukprot:COSAG02_NODE_603_length_19693_cov_3.883944_20_plen_234_part_00